MAATKGIRRVWLVVFASVVLQMRAADPDPMAPLDEALKSVAVFEYGKDSASLELVEQIVVASSQNQERRTNVEQRLLQVLQKPCTRDGKEFICRQLFTIGTAMAIPQLEALLTDPSLSHIARYALGRNEDPAALLALHRALLKTSGSLQAGLAGALGARHYRPATADIAKLLRSPNVEVAEAAAIALGRIAGLEAVSALESAQSKAHEPVRSRIDQALLACAEQYVTENHSSAAEKIYEAFYAPDQPRNLRLSALHGLVLVRQESAMPLLLDAIQSADSTLRAAAISFSALSKSSDSTKLLVGLLPTLPPQSQALLITALAERGDRTALPAVMAAAKSPNETISIAASEALGTLGNGSCVDLLIAKASGPSARDQLIARASLVRMSDSSVNSALQAVLKLGDRKAKMESIRALANRHAQDSVMDMIRVARESDPQLRIEAIHGLGSVVDERTLPQLLELTSSLLDPLDLASAEEAIATVTRKINDPKKVTDPLLISLSHASPQIKPTFIRLLSIAGSPQALKTVREALTDPSPQISDAAFRAMTDWPTPAPADDLLSMLQSTNSASRKVLALRGYIRMAALVEDPAVMYARALSAAERPVDKKLVLSNLGRADPAKVLPLVEDCMRDEQLRPEASLAIIEIAERLRETDAPRAKSAIKKVLALSSEPRTRQLALDCLQRIEPREGHILEWMISGPYKEKNKDARALFDQAFPPEQNSSTSVKWTHPSKGIGAWDMNLAEALGNEEDVVAYAKTRIWSGFEQEARLELGSDDGIKAWLNGLLVHTNNTERGLAPRQDIVKVRLKEGWNELLLKVTNRSDGWGFACRVRQPDGAAIEDLRAQPQ